MSEDPPSSLPAIERAPERPAERRSWLERLSDAFSGELRSLDDLHEVLTEAHENSLLSADTLAMLQGALSVAEQQVGDAMIPRGQMVSLPVDAPIHDVLAAVVESGHSRFPVHGEDKDEILGILLAKDLLRGFAEGHPASCLRELLRPVVLIPESKRLDVLLKEFRQSRNHMAIVIDEYGGVAGLITIEDVLEEIVGDIDDEHDDAPDAQQQIATQADGQFVVDALTPIEDFNQHFAADFPDDEYDTVGGLVVAAIGHLPEAGEELVLGRFHFRVASADGRRVHAFHLGIHD